MKLLEQIIQENPGIEEDTKRGRNLYFLLGDTAMTIGLMEYAVREFSDPPKITQFYDEVVDYLRMKFEMNNENARERANTLLGYAATSFKPHRDIWYDTLPEIHHPILGRNKIPADGRVIADLTVAFKNPALVERVESYLRDLPDGLLTGNISYETVSSDPPQIKLFFGGHMGQSEENILYLGGILDGIFSRMKLEIGSPIEYTLHWNAREVDDTQSYWEEKLNYIRDGNNWFERDLKTTPKQTDAWVEDAYIGQYPVPTMSGTPAPYGLHLRFNLSGEDVGTGLGVKTGWTFVGSQIDEFLEACGIKDISHLKGKKFTIYEVGMKMVGVQAYQGK